MSGYFMLSRNPCTHPKYLRISCLEDVCVQIPECARVCMHDGGFWTLKGASALSSPSEKMHHLPLPLLFFFLCFGAEAGKSWGPSLWKLQDQFLKQSLV